jgi:hypothetical protein
MDDFSKYFKNMLDQFMKSGIGNELNFDIKAFDLNSASSSASPLMQMFFGGATEKKEKLAVRKLTEEELKLYQELEDKKDEIQSQFRRLVNQQKKMEADIELFWQDLRDSSHLKVDPKNLSIDAKSGFLFQEVDVNAKEEDKDKE